MVSNTNEQALEAAIEQALTGTTSEAVKAAGGVADGADAQVKETPADYLVGNQRFKLGLPTDFNAQYALDEKLFWRFLEHTQKPELTKLQKHNPSDWQRKLLERYDRLMKKHGILHLLKKGLPVDDAHFHLMYPALMIKLQFHRKIYHIRPAWPGFQ